MEQDALQPTLDEAQRALDAALDEACKVDVKRATTGEMIRIEETLAVAANAAKEVVSVRLRRRTAKGQSATPQLEDAPASDATDRVFDDPEGRRWHVYAVHPSVGTVRSGALAEAFRHGWLCFESHDERRRLAPVPEQWEALSDVALAELCRNAEVATRHA